MDGNRGKRGILLFSNRKYLFALGTFLINLQKHVDYDKVLVYHEGFSDEEIGAIRKGVCQGVSGRQGKNSLGEFHKSVFGAQCHQVQDIPASGGV